MTGVKILSSEQVVTESVFNWSVFCIIFGIFFGVLSLIGFVSWLSGKTERATILSCALLGLALGLMFGSMGGDVSAIPTAYETQYKVVISDEVSFNDFCEHYKVINQEGKIFTVKEKNK